jgi:predicted permease
MTLWKRLAYLFPWRRRAADRDMQEELQSIAAMAEPGELGNLTLTAEDARAQWGWTWLERVGQDVRYAWRILRKSPAFAATAVLSLALGIGANSAIFAALDAAFWKPLPVADAQSLVNFSITRVRGGDETDLPAGLARRLRDSGIFAGILVSNSDGLSVSFDDRAERIIGQAVSPDYFSLLGVQPALGQAFSPAVQAGQWSAEAVLSYDYWKRRFGADPLIIGRAIRLNTVLFTVVGVAPPSFFGLARGSDYELRIPILPDGRSLSPMKLIDGLNHSWWGATARLRPHQSLAAAEAAADVQLQAFLRTTTDEEVRSAGLRHLRLLPGSGGDFERTLQFRTPLFVLMVLALIVLLIACANVGSLLLARATARTRELAVRVSIGASRSRLIRQLLTESLFLSLLGGVAGVGAAYGMTRLLVRFVPQGHVTVVLDLNPDGRVLLFTMLITLVSGVVVGVIPALQASHSSTAAMLKSDTGGSIGDRRGAAARRTLVAAQVAFSLLLLVAANAFVHTLMDLRPNDYRANPGRVLLFTMKPQQEIYTDDRKRQLAAELVRRVAQLPGVRSAALAENGPLGSRISRALVSAQGHNPLRVDSDAITPGFFDTVGIARVAGRDFTEQDTLGSPRVIVVNQALARRLFPGANPVGRILHVPDGEANAEYQIVGLVADVPYYDLHKTPQPAVWFAIEQTTPYMPTLHVRIDTPDVAPVTASIRREFDALDKGFPVFNVRTMEGRIEDSMAGERMIASLSGGFGALALVLATVGLYGTLAYSVSRRTREIGIRRALGSRAGPVLWMVAREALWLVGAGSVVGSAVAITASHGLARYVGAVPVVTPAILVSSGCTMLLLSVTAVVAPSFRACRVDPLSVLRGE